ncbi:hypothetical protein CQ062_13595 [Ochrobactrum sp. MYb68]|nr:hypothetical protein CQ062_13595 [Ochrobactrum sp. MYb68]
MADTKFTPGPWSVGHLGSSIVCVNAKIGGEAKLFDIRGWGYFTGKGHGALGLSDEDAVAIQAANANLASASPELYESLEDVLGLITPEFEQSPMVSFAKAALAKARGEAV